MAQSIKEVTQGNEFKSQTHTVKLPNNSTITRTVDGYKRSVLKHMEAAKLALAFGKTSTATLCTFLQSKNVEVSMHGTDMKFSKNHINKMLRILWESAGVGTSVTVYKPKAGFAQAIKTILGTTSVKSVYTAKEVKKFSDNGILDQMFNAETTRVALKLPTINGYSGKITGKNIVYGCASLPIAWFAIPNGGTRQIKSLVLSSGVQVSAEQVTAIYAYLKENNIK